MVVTQCAPIQDLHNTVDPDEGTTQGVVAAEWDRQVIGVRHVANHGQGPHRQLLDAVVLVVADHEHPMLTTTTKQGPDLAPSHHCESRRAMSLLLSMSNVSSLICRAVR